MLNIKHGLKFKTHVNGKPQLVEVKKDAQAEFVRGNTTTNICTLVTFAGEYEKYGDCIEGTNPENCLGMYALKNADQKSLFFQPLFISTRKKYPSLSIDSEGKDATMIGWAVVEDENIVKPSSSQESIADYISNVIRKELNLYNLWLSNKVFRYFLHENENPDSPVIQEVGDQYGNDLPDFLFG